MAGPPDGRRRMIRGAGGWGGADLSIDGGCRRKDGDSAEWMQFQEVLVPGHKDVCATVHGGLEEFVVLRIARRSNWLQDLYDFDERCQAHQQRVASFARYVAIKSRREQLRHQLPKCVGGGDELRG